MPATAMPTIRDLRLKKLDELCEQAFNCCGSKTEIAKARFEGYALEGVTRE